MFARWLCGDERGDQVSDLPLVVLDLVDAEQVESVADAGQVGDDLLIAGHAYGASDRGPPGAREVDSGQTSRARGEERIDDVDFH